MIDISCPKCSSEQVGLIYNYLCDIETLENGNIIIYYYCFECKTEYEIVYRPEEKSITVESNERK